MKRRFLIACLSLVSFQDILPVGLSSSYGQEKSGVAETDQVAAIIDGQIEIRLGEANRLVDTSLKSLKVSPEIRKEMLKRAVEQLVHRQIILSYLNREKKLASETAVKAHIDDLQKQLTKRSQTWEEYLKKLGVTEEEFRRSVVWKLSWDEYLDSVMTKENLLKYFTSHRKDYDGTELEVSQVLFFVAADSAEEKWESQAKKANEVHAELESGKIKFEDAAKKYSDGSTAKDGGDIGKIQRNGPMPSSFNDAAYSLTAGEFSKPIRTNFGYHIILCRRVIPGTKGFDEVQEEVVKGARQFLFDELVKQEAVNHKIEWK